MVRRDSLEEITGRIKGSVLSGNITPETRNDYREFHRRLLNKVDSIRQLKYFKGLFLEPGQEIYEESFFELDDLEKLFRRDVEIKLNFMDTEGVLYIDEEIIPCVREEDKLIFSNPAVIDGRSRVQSWDRVESIGREYGKHTSNSRKNGSKFRKGLDIEEVEFEVFNNGRGYLDPRNPTNRLYLFKEFCGEVGSEGEKIVKLQADRIGRNKGYRTEIHGYPITASEAERDFPEGF